MWHLAVAAGAGILVVVLGFVAIRSGAPPLPGEPPVELIPPEITNKMAAMADEIFDVKKLDFDKGVIVHLFEWPWKDIALECESFLAPKGFKGVQISPPTEHRILEGRPWFERYQVVSYELESRSGTRAELEDMVKRCNKAGIRVFAEVVINHMTSDGECKGIAGSECKPEERVYGGEKNKKRFEGYTEKDFHYPQCDISNPYNATEVRVCELFKLHDLDQGMENVRKQIVAMMNELIKIGVAGFRINAAMNIWPDHLFQIYSYLDHLNPEHGFEKHTRPFVYQEIVDLDQGAVKYTEYTPLGLVTDARYGRKLSDFMKHKKQSFTKLQDFGASWLVPDLESVVYLDDYNTERHSENYILNYNEDRAYKMAIAFMLAWGHGIPLLHSGYKFKNYDEGPPVEEGVGGVVSPSPNEENICDHRWVCQHRWRQVYNMVAFHQHTKGEKITYWWHNQKELMFHFNMGTKAVIAFNFEEYAFSTTIKTFLPPGEYCDIISGINEGNSCSGRMVEVQEGPDGDAHIYIERYNEDDKNSDGVLAIMDHPISRKL